MVKKVSVIFIVIMMLLALSPNVSAEQTFTDVPEDSWYYKAICWAIENGITSGTSETTFGPDTTCTRAQAVTFLWRYAGSPTNYNQSTAAAAQDIPDGKYYTTAMRWAVAKGIMYPNNGKVSPSAKIIRQDFSYYIFNYCVMLGIAPQNYPHTIDQYEGIFQSVSAIPGWARSAISWCLDNNIILGKSKSNMNLTLTSNATRAEIITILYGVNKLVQCGGHSLIYTKTIQPTCTSCGYDELNCTNCNAKILGNWVQALGHDYSKAKLVSDATFSSTTKYRFVCSRCEHESEIRSIGKPILDYPNPRRGYNTLNVLTWGANSGNGKKTISLYNNSNGTIITLTRKWFGSAWCYIADIQLTPTTYSKFKGASTYNPANNTITPITAYDKIRSLSNAVILISGDACLFNEWGNLRGNVAYGTSVSTNDSHYWNPKNGTFGSLASLNLGSEPKIANLKSLGITDTFRFWGGTWIKNGKLTEDLASKSDNETATYQETNGRRQATFMGFKKSGSTIHVYLIVSDGNPFSNFAPSSDSVVKAYASDAASYGLSPREKKLLLATLGCDYAFPLDGGGSSSMTVRYNETVYQVNGIENWQTGRVRPVWDFLYFEK